MLEIERVDFGTIEPLRERFRGDAGCQIVHDSILPRRLADSCPRGRGEAWFRVAPGRLMVAPATCRLPEAL